MSQFKIKGIDYTDDSLQHASYVRTTGRTNPYGSMKIGSKEYREKYNAGAFQDEHGVWYGKGSRALNQRDGKKRQREQEAAARQNLNSKIPTIVARDRRPLSQRKPVNLQQRTVTTTTTTTQSSNPAAATARGKEAVAQLMGGAVDPRGQAQPLEGFPKRKLQDAQGQTIIDKDVRQQINNQNNETRNTASQANSSNAQSAASDVNPINTNEIDVNPIDTNEIDVRPINIRTIEETMAPEQHPTETPQQKSLWDTIGSWFSQAGQDIANTAVGAWDTISGAAGDAAKWVGDRLNEAGDWAQTAIDDISQWVGDRAGEFDTWLNGRQIVGKQGNTWREGGALNDVGNALNTAGQWIGNAAGDVGRWIGNAAGDVSRAASNLADNVLGKYQVVDQDENGNLVYGNQRYGGLLNQAGQAVGNFANQAGRFVTDTAGNVWDTVSGTAVNLADNLLGRYPVIDTDENGNLVYGNQRQGGLFNQGLRAAGNLANQGVQALGNAAGQVGQFVGGGLDAARSGVTNLADNVLGKYQVVDQDENGNLVYGNQRYGGLLNQAGQAVGNFANQAGRFVTDTAGNVWDTVSGTAVNLADNLLGRYPVIDTDENGNLVYGNQRQGGLFNQGLRAAGNLANQGIDWINNDIVTPVGTAVDNVLNGAPATNRYYDTQTGRWVEPGDRVGGVVPWIRDRAADATNLARNAYNTAEGAVVDAADAVRDTAVNAYNAGRDAYNNYQDDQNIRNLARQSAAYQNAPEESRQQVEQSYSDRYRSARNNQAYQAAVSAGVPTAQLNSLINDFAQGSIDNFTFNNELARLGNLYANVYNQ